MAEFYKTEKILTNENINLIVSELTGVYVEKVKKNGIKETAFRIALEEMLLRYRDFYDETKPCRIVFYKYFGKFGIDISEEGDRKEWLPCDEDIKISYDILARLGIEPRYVYSHIGEGRNRIVWESFAENKKPSMLIAIVIAVIIAVIAGLLINSLSPDVHNIVSKEIVSPIFTKLTAVISAIATPLVFFAVISGIVGIGDAKSFGKIGTRFIKRMMSSYIIAALLLGVGGLLAYGITSAENVGGDGSAIGNVVKLVLDIVPDNLVTPFSNDNDLQVIVIAVFVGFTILLLGNALSKLNGIIKEITDLVNKMMILCCKLLPFIVFFGVTNLIVSSNAKQFLSIGKMFLVYLAINGVFILYMILRAMFVTKTSIKTIFPKQFATFLINITTASQVAALPENMKCCKKKFGIDEKLVDFGLPLGIVVYMPSGAIFIGMTALGLSATLGIPIGISNLIKIMLISIILAIAAPPIPGSALVILPVLLASCGIPSDALPLGIIFGTIVGYVLPAFNGINIQLELLTTAKKMNKLDEKILKEPYNEE